MGEGEWLPLLFFRVPWGKENGSLFCSSFMCRVVHLSRGHRVSPLTVGRLCVLECEYVWYGWYRECILCVLFSWCVFVTSIRSLVVQSRYRSLMYCE